VTTSTLPRHGDAPPSSTLARLARRYPKTVAAFSRMEGGERALDNVIALERRWLELNSGTARPDPFRYVPTTAALPGCAPGDHYDVVIAGGSLGLVSGVGLAQRGLRVLVFDRDKVGAAHREWNISRRELAALSGWGIFTPQEIARTIATEYRQGVISFDATGTGGEACPLYLEGVLDVALDAQSVLDLARRRFLKAGGTILEGRSFRRLHLARTGPVASVFEVEGPSGTEYYRTRLAIDTMGSVSPISVGLNGGLPFDGVCPTAGTIVEGLHTDSSTGDVLVSVAGASEGRQLVWEGFPGRRGETTVYLFYYDRTGGNRASKQGLLDLFEQYFAQLPAYKPFAEGARHLRPVYGYIPARHGRPGKSAARGLLCLGDSAAGQSPLTFCGFGSFVRHVGRVSALISYALRHDLLEERHLRAVSPHQANLRVAWVFSRLMQPWSAGDPACVNRLMNVFCGALREVGAGPTVRFLQDRYTFAEYLRIMLATARRYPGVFPLVARVIGPSGLLKWLKDIAAFATDDLLRTVYSVIGAARWLSVERLAARVSPGLRLTLAARRTLWRAIE
jgi:lycopene cyclase CruA